MLCGQTTPMDQKTQFIADYLRRRLSITELCEFYRISRKTGYKVIVGCTFRRAISPTILLLTFVKP